MPRRIFEAFADGGEVGMPLGETFWAPLFGTCTDRFGVNWMVNVDAGDIPPTPDFEEA
jgi:PhnB protein